MAGDNRIFIHKRKEVRLEGVLEVISFDAKKIHLVTNMGELCLEGEDLHISHMMLEDEKVYIEGLICAIYYPINTKKEKKEKRQGFLKKLMS